MTLKHETIPASNGTGVPLATTIVTPARRRGSVRRTLSVDMERPDGLDGVIVLRGLGRDLVTGTDGEEETVATASLDVVIEPDGIIREARSAERELAEFVGKPSGTGFRALLDDASAADLQAGSLLYQLLDDVPVTAMITGYMDARSGEPRKPRRHAGAPAFLNVCAGWIEGGASHRRTSSGTMGMKVMGPEATPLTDGTDPLAWHEQATLTVGSMRRRRRVDVWRADGLLHADSVLRDVFIEPGDIETLVHEYALSTDIDVETMTVIRSAARHGALPAFDCPAATPSAERIAGLSLVALRETVRRQFRGPTTCTHLNDSLRTLADIGALAQLLDTKRPQ